MFKVILYVFASLLLFGAIMDLRVREDKTVPICLIVASIVILLRCGELSL